jgi:hypothetical protein
LQAQKQELNISSQGRTNVDVEISALKIKKKTFIKTPCFIDFLYDTREIDTK